MNISATLNVSRLLLNPGLATPHLVLNSFDQLPIPLKFANHQSDIKAVVLDKDNCFAKDKDDKVWPAYETVFNKLKETYPLESLLIVSNSAGTNDDIDHVEAVKLEKNTGIAVLRHSTKKPGCYQEILDHFIAKGVITGPHELVVIGDRLFTDVLMGNIMGSWSVWLRQGVEESQKLLVRGERGFYDRLASGYTAQAPTKDADL